MLRKVTEGYGRLRDIDEGQPVSEATFFSRSSKSLRSTLDLSSSKTRFIRSSFRVMSRRFSSIFSVFFPTCSNMLSNLFCMPGIASRTGLNSALIASISTPTSVALNLLSFLRRFFINNIIIEREFSVKQKTKDVREEQNEL